MNNELSRWFASQPFLTKWISVASLVIPLMLKFQIISPHYLVFYWPHILKSAQIWRPFTSLFIAQVNINFIFSLYFRHQYSTYLETLQFAGQPADYLWFLLMTVGLLTAFNAYMGLAVLWEGFSMAIVHLWSQYNKAVTVNFMFGFRFPAVYLPAVMTAYSFLLGGDIMGTLMGIVVGHIFYFGKEILGRQNPRIQSFFEAPRLLRNLVGQPWRMAAGESVTKKEGFTVYAPKNAAVKSEQKSDDGVRFRPFTGTGKKLGAD